MQSATAEKAIKAYGGMKLWQAADYIEAEVSAHGLAFILKRRPFFKHAKILLQLERPFCRLTPIGKISTITGVLDGQNVRLEDQDGEVVAEREKARKYFSFGRRLLYCWEEEAAFFLF